MRAPKLQTSRFNCETNNDSHSSVLELIVNYTHGVTLIQLLGALLSVDYGTEIEKYNTAEVFWLQLNTGRLRASGISSSRRKMFSSP